MLLALEMSGVTPPFGLNLFVMMGVAPAGNQDGGGGEGRDPVSRLRGLVLFAFLVLEPDVALYLPSLMNRIAAMALILHHHNSSVCAAKVRVAIRGEGT